MAGSSDKQFILVPGLYDPPSGAHAVRAGNLVLTGGIVGLDRQGRHPAPDLAGQARQAYANLGAILAAAGAGWDDVAKLTLFLAPPWPSADELAALRAERDRHLAPGRQAGFEVAFALPDPGCRLVVEAVAHVGTGKQVLGGGGDAAGLGAGWAAGVRCGSALYLSGRRPAGAGNLTEQTRAIYGQFDALLREAGAGWRDLLRVRQHIADTAIRFDDVREGRSGFVPAGRFLSTSVACLPDRLATGDDAGASWLIAVEAEALQAPKVCLNTTDVIDTPGVPHAIRTAGMVQVQAQIATDHADRVVCPDDVEGQARQVYGALDRMLAAAGTGWRHLLRSRIYVKNPADLAAVRATAARWTGGTPAAATELVARFFDPEVLLEVEVVAAG
jgi:enamine deaminase RidA (YjgF/YER057c/UK114 family)